MNSSIRVLIADDHLIFRMGLRSLLNNEPDIKVVGEANTGAQTVETCNRLQPDIVLLDLRMPDGGGLGALAQLQQVSSPAKVLVLSSYASEEEIYRALQAGASGYVLKDIGRDELTRAIRRVHQGGEWIQPSLQSILAGRADRHPLTSRELEVLTLMVRGLTNREIGKVLGNSENTVRNHTIRIFAKLYVSDRAEAVAAALQRGIVIPS
jgi:DNA-binding NarL/FixJ family response regulator